MKFFLTFVFLTARVYAATVSVCASGCTTTSLQTALDTTAACGDTITIKSTEVQTGNFTIKTRGCTSASPITVTTDRSLWLPPAGGRITPSYLSNMAIIASNSTSPALSAVLTAGTPARGWVFQGIAFRSSTGVTYNLVSLNEYSATSSSQLAREIIFNQCYFYQTLPNTENQYTQNMMRADGIDITVKNSYFGDGMYLGVESHGIHLFTTPGPVTLENNYITASSIPIFSGGAVPTYPTYLESGATVRYNYTFRPEKWNGDPSQPYASWYVSNVSTSGASTAATITVTNISSTGIITHVADGFYSSWPVQFVWNITGVGGCTVANSSGWRATSIDTTHTQLLNFPGCNSAYTSGGTATAKAFQPCLKNHGEFKFGQSITWQYNVGENSVYEVACQSQYNGFTGTFRTQWDGSNFTAAMGTVAFTDTTHLTWSGAYRIGNIASGAQTDVVTDLGVCVSMPTTGTECHPISSYSGASLVVSTAFSAAPGSPGAWWIVYTYSAGMCNVEVKDNIFRNVPQGVTNLAMSYGALSCTGTNKFNNNLVVNNTYPAVKPGMYLSAAEADYSTSPSGYEWEHNTFYSPNGWGPFLYFGATNCSSPTCKTSIQPSYTSSSWSNNLMGETSTGGNGPFSGDSKSTISDTVNFYMTSSSVKNNVIPGATAGSGCTGGNTCSGNIVTTWVSPFKGSSYKVDSTTYAGSDGKAIGVNSGSLPAILGLSVNVAATHALLSFTLSAPIRLASTTQPCALEISADENLHSTINTYPVVNAINPVYFKQGDSSAGTNSLLPSSVLGGSTVFWPIGANSSVTDDGGVSRSLALTPSTLYYGRLMCYGDTQKFTFTTASSDHGYSSTTIYLGSVPTSTTTVRLHYGATSAMSSTSDTSATGATSITLPLNADYTYYQLEYRNGGGSIKYAPTNVVIN
jgi:hypothetical protein